MRWITVVLLLGCVSSPSQAFWHGQPHGGQTVINAPSAPQYSNLLKGIYSLGQGNTDPWPGYMNADNYPASADLPSGVGSTFDGPYSTYYGHYTYAHTGCGSISLGNKAIVYNGGANISASLLYPTPGANTGSTAYDLPMWNVCNPVVELAYGALVGGIADNGSGKVRLTSLIPGNGFVNLNGVHSYQVTNINGIAPGVYSLTYVDDAHLDILGLNYNSGTMSVIGGGPGPASEIIAALGQGNFSFINGHTTTWTMSNALHCKTADYNSNYCQTHMFNADFVAQVRDTLKPGFVRFMDEMLTNTMSHTFATRPRNSHLAFLNNGASFSPLLWVGAIHRGASDAYTSNNPSGSPASGAYVDNEMVQGQVDLTNVANNPTLALAGRSSGAKPILTSSSLPLTIFVGGTPVVGDVFNFTATASYLGGGAHTMPYTLVSGDTSTTTLASHLCTAVNNDATFLAANIVCNTAYGAFFNIIYNRNGQGVTPVVATVFSSSRTGTGTEALAIGTMLTAAQDPLGGLSLGTNQLSTFRYSKIFDAWIFYQGGYTNGVSIEAMADLCNQTGAGCWANIPTFYSGADVTSFIQTFAANLNSSVPLAIEYSNEVWNSASTPTQHAVPLGVSLGFPWGSGVTAWNGFYGMRFKQYGDLATAAWAGAGRPRSLLNLVLAGWFIGMAQDPPPTDDSINRLNGGVLVTTNPSYNAFGGVDGGAGTNYSTFPNRPIDIADALSIAPYWQGPLIGQFAYSWQGAQAPFNVLMQAGVDYASGIPAQMASALAAMDTESRSGFATYPSLYANMQTLMSGYDAQRAGAGKAPLNRYDYEGGDQQGLGADFNGTQDLSPAPSNIGYAPLSAQLTSLVSGSGWNISAYGASSDIVAQRVITAWLAWKNSSLFQATCRLYLQQIATAHPGRRTMGAWYGYSGPASWEFFPGSIYTTPQQSYNAFANWP